MNITLNGVDQTVADGTSVSDLVAKMTGEADPKGIAVALDRCVVPRSEWGTTTVCSGSVLEIVTAAAGG
ncbi:MAG TPA: sulfur carrier protein ThiS [Acidimicrobiales bacterium]